MYFQHQELRGGPYLTSDDYDGDHELACLTFPEQRNQRAAANVRERRRMQCINEAFEGLRRHIPTLPYEKRLSKVETLRLAINYINFLSEIVKQDSQEKRPEIGGGSSEKIVIFHRSYNHMESDERAITGHSLSWFSNKKTTNRLVQCSGIWIPRRPLQNGFDQRATIFPS